MHNSSFPYQTLTPTIPRLIFFSIATYTSKYNILKILPTCHAPLRLISSLVLARAEQPMA